MTSFFIPYYTRSILFGYFFGLSPNTWLCLGDFLVTFARLLLAWRGGEMCALDRLAARRLIGPHRPPACLPPPPILQVLLKVTIASLSERWPPVNKQPTLNVVVVVLKAACGIVLGVYTVTQRRNFVNRHVYSSFFFFFITCQDTFFAYNNAIVKLRSIKCTPWE